MRTGCDYSTYETGPLDDSTVQTYLDLGFDKVCLAIDTAPETLQAAQKLHEAGIALTAYRELSGPSGYQSQLQDALNAFAQLAAQQIYFDELWLTAEDTSQGEGYDYLTPFRAAVNFVRNYNIGIYTGSWYWGNEKFIDTNEFSNLKLWLADYDDIASLNTVSFGGWSKCNAKQYGSPVLINGINHDLDVWE